jgi:undecaprenyldiphospho-muramoylpentapeptide beta-N-acetylglucosaminyltransferase
MKTIVLTGGGTSGHVTPNIALIPELKTQGCKIHYIGSKKGIEKQLIEKEGITYHSINTGKLRRYFDLKNFTDVFRVGDGFRQAFSILGKLKPDLVFSKGGFVACPVVWAAWVRKIPVIIHESDMTPGLTNKLSIPFCKKICYTFPETEKYIPKEKGILTGIPIRDSLLKGDLFMGRKLCGFTAGKPVILIIGGSQGSEFINNAIRSIMSDLLPIFQICHICGKNNIDKETVGLEGYKQFEYVNEELTHLFAAADIVVSRAGATAIFEILALKKPSLLIPLSKASSRGDQLLNAESFEKQGYCKVLKEEELDSTSLKASLFEIYGNREKYIDNMKKSKSGKGNDAILKVIGEYI